jgi:hypothetical protein
LGFRARRRFDSPCPVGDGMFTDKEVVRLKEIERKAYNLTLIEEGSLSSGATPAEVAGLIAQLCSLLTNTVGPTEGADV